MHMITNSMNNNFSVRFSISNGQQPLWGTLGPLPKFWMAFLKIMPPHI